MNLDPKDIMLKLAQECIKNYPVIILGSGASAAYGIPGMPKLQEHLLNVACPDIVNPADVQKWDEFKIELGKNDLESALNEVRLPESLTKLVVTSTWDYLTPFDYKVFERAIVDRKLFPLTKLFGHLFESTRKEIHVVTPNYDRIAEYAADAGHLFHYTGFNYGHLRTRSINGKPSIKIGKNVVPIVNIWKVHGSFDWFRDNDGVVMGLPISKERPKTMTPVIVTPGIEKYRITHEEPFHSIKTEADRALQNADAYLCIGYGFNDTHLQTTLVERCRSKDALLVLLTKHITGTAKEFLKSGKCAKYLAIEEANNGSCIY